ncbi:MAG: hypothetical protein ACD_18C00112G0001 [uncultured bacterium]|nr:MAG: hypothetical protein ACD_18C00112G0001 [uncultured bacterium]OGH84491.1 MAG: hypothetical protein A2488_01430 [Candidatus Magasanikbacteria bacterium RIFOXYC12_FULL_32_21b]OGH91261.1 MAG: hypothetical protein A2507_04455 [Candidatus Magasanikbacteria bacterium RIFOXYD12_FULL_33_17]HAO52510.1 GIY-YIG nuclease superfamily protein [Candidatus Magasanikbacteria bacterium]
MHYLYFLWSEKLQKIYIGETTDLFARIDYHNNGRQRYTSRGIPWTPIAYLEFENRTEALAEEKRLKKCKNREYYKKYLLENGKKIKNQ